jgi:hypothetical protein
MPSSSDSKAASMSASGMSKAELFTDVTMGDDDLALPGDIAAHDVGRADDLAAGGAPG